MDSGVITDLYIYRSVGVICKRSDSHFIWVVQQFSDFQENFDSFFSPLFQYKGHSWSLRCELSTNDSGHLITFQIVRIPTPFSNPCNLTHRMFIKDINGEDYWSTPVLTHEFSPTNESGTSQGFRLRNMSLITTEDSLYLHLTLETEAPSPPQESVFTSTETSRITVKLKTQTSPELETKPRCSNCSSGGGKVLKNLNDLLLSGQKSDVTFNVKGTAIKAHKIILTARSPVFEKMFAHEMVEETTGSVEITDCEPEDFRAFLLYLYTGKVEKPTVESAVELYCLANKYCIEDLGPHCVQFLLGNLSVASFCDILPIALQHCKTELIDSANMFFRNNLKQIVSSPKWKDFNKENPNEATEILVKSLT